MLLASGVEGELHSGYYRAAMLGRWRVDVDERRLIDGRFVCTVTVLSRNAFRFEHGAPFDLVLVCGPQRWRWHAVEFEDGEPATIQLVGKPETL